jgi:spermidine synthase
VKPLKTLHTEKTRDGELSLKQRGEKDFLLTIDGRVLMTSTARRSELALGSLACRRLANHSGPRVLIGGLGMAYTLRAVLDELPPTANVVVAELNPAIVTWCKGPLAVLTNDAVSDPRVTVELRDVMKVAQKAADGGIAKRFDAIVIDLYVGPDANTREDDHLYGRGAIQIFRAGLKPDGVLTVWGEAYDAGYVRRLEKAGFTVSTQRPGQGGLRHIVYVAKAG